MTAVATQDPLLGTPPAGIANDTLYEVVNGKYVELPPMSTTAGRIASRLVRKLGNFTEEQQLGEVVGDILFGLNPTGKLRRRPDVAFVSYKRWPKDRPVTDTDPWMVIPDLAIEVVSPSDFAEEVRIKTRDYFEAGVRQVWLIYPKPTLVDVFESLTVMRSWKATDTLDGGALLPGLQLPLGPIFEGQATD
jgi:Uma2 family endonuclease